MLQTRVWTAVIALPALLAAIRFAPDRLFTALIAMLGAIGLYEIGAITGAKRPVAVTVLLVAGVGPAIAVFLAPGAFWWLSVLAFVATLALTAAIAAGRVSSVPHGVVLTGLGALWVGALFPYFALLRNGAGGIALTILLLLLVVVSDSAAYFTGMGLGRTKLAPRLSPNKTVEGALGGLAACIAAGFVLRGALAPDWSAGAIATLAVVTGGLAQLGDLIGSGIKRAAGVKDSGWLFPGHGGLLDRTCSLVFAAAFTYYCSW